MFRSQIDIIRDSETQVSHTSKFIFNIFENFPPSTEVQWGILFSRQLLSALYPTSSIDQLSYEQLNLPTALTKYGMYSNANSQECSTRTKLVTTTYHSIQFSSDSCTRFLLHNNFLQQCFQVFLFTFLYYCRYVSMYLCMQVYLQEQ